IEEDGKLCSIQKLNQLQYLQALKSKLEEEVSEYIHSGNDNDSIEELADIVEVIYSLAKIHGKSFKEVEEFR
ncbi:nucleoside triphosphate pyrophosphohydrolase, partial [Klebsiella pneumoniae]|uniref:nucleoside triphosphate pyrophosphohydrolase n=2 Tax=Bacteria TaxID=2 RepID=UPI000E2F6165